MIFAMFVLQVVVGIGYIVISRFNFSEARSEQIQSYLIFGLFMVAIANVIIASFAFDDHVCEMLARNTMMNRKVDVIDQQPELNSANIVPQPGNGGNNANNPNVNVNVS